MTSATCESGIVASLAGSRVHKNSINITVDKQTKPLSWKGKWIQRFGAPAASPDLCLVSKTARGHGAADATDAN